MLPETQAPPQAKTQSSESSAVFRPRKAEHFYDSEGTLQAADIASEVMLGRPMDGLIGHRLASFLDADDSERLHEQWATLLQEPGSTQQGRYQFELGDGSTIWLQVVFENLVHSHGWIRSVLEDVSSEMTTLTVLRERERLLARLADALPTGVLQFDAGFAEVFSNDKAETITGVPSPSSVLKYFRSISPEDRRAVWETGWESIRTESDLDVEASMIHTVDQQHRRVRLSFRPLLAADQLDQGVLLCIDDITEAWALREKLAHQALRDGLTGLANRTAIVAALQKALDDAKVTGATTALLFFDLDGFKPINDTYGHAAGDELLIEVSKSLQEAVRNSDTVGRLGGDEFVVICVEAGDRVEEVVKRIRSNSRVEIEMDGKIIACESSCGFATDTGGKLTAEELLETADSLMYADKKARGGGR